MWIGPAGTRASVRAVERNVAEASFPIPATSEVTVGLPDGNTASPHDSTYAPTFYRKRPEVKHILRDCIPPVDCIAPIAVRGSTNSRQVGNHGQVKYHHYSQIPAKCIPSSNRVAH